MTGQPGTIAAALGEAGGDLWANVERGRADAVGTALESRLDAKDDASRVRDRLLLALAQQNAGKHLQAFETASQAVSAPSPFGVWARAERTYAARAQAQIRITDNERVSAAEAEGLRGSEDPWSRLAAARAYLALGLEATQDNRLEESAGLLDSAFRLMQGVGSKGGMAVASLELGKLRAWQGRSDDALLNLLSGLAIWRGLDEQRSVGIWHEIGAALSDSRNYVEAVAILDAAFAQNRSTRTQNALTRALIGLGNLDDAEVQAKAVVEAEERVRAQNPKHDTYRQIMAFRDLSEIALRKRLSALQKNDAARADDQLEIADARFNDAVSLYGASRSGADSLFTRWIGALDKATRKDEKPTIGFTQLRLVQIELLLDAVKRPAEAGRNLAKVADVYGQRNERMQELEARDQAAEAFERAEDFSKAAQQLELAMRVAEIQGAANVARQARERLAAITTKIRHGEAPAPGFLVRGVERAFPFGKILSATDISSGRRVRIYRHEIPGSMAARAGDGLKALQIMFGGDVRVVPGLPTIVKKPPSPEKDGKAPGQFELIAESADGECLADAIEASKGKLDENGLRRAIRVVRDLSFTIGLYHEAGLKDFRPDPKEIVLDLGGNPTCLTLLPLHADGPRQPIEDVRALASLLVRWITGEAPKSRALTLKPGQMRRIFDPGAKLRVPAGLDDLLSAILLHHKDEPTSPRELADRLQAFC